MKPKPWTMKEIKYLKENYKHMRISDLADKLGRTYGSIHSQRQKMGLTKEYDKREYALYKNDDLLHIGSMEELAKFRGVRKETIQYYATPAYRRRIEKRNNPGSGITLVRLDDDIA